MGIGHARWAAMSCLLGLPACSATVVVLVDDGPATASSGSGTAPGACQPRLFEGDRSGASCLASDDRYAYWDTNAGHIERGDTHTGKVIVVAEGTGNTTNALALSAPWLYVVSEHRIRRVPTGGGTFETVATGNWTVVGGAVADASGVYFIHDDGNAVDGRLEKWSEKTGVQTLAKGLFLVGGDLCQGALSQDVDNVYVLVGGAVVSVPKNGGKTDVNEVDVPGLPTSLGLHNQRFYIAWAAGASIDADAMDSGVSVVSMAGATIKELPLPHGEVSAFELAVIGGDAFLSGTVPQTGICCGSGPGVLWRVPLSGAAPSLITTESAHFRLIRVGDALLASRSADTQPTSANAELFCP